MAAITDILTTILRIQGVSLVIQGFTAVQSAVVEAADTFVQFETALLRAQFMLNEWGNSMPTAQIAAFDRELSLSTGVSQTAIAGLEAYLARFRGAAFDIERATRVLTNASLVTGISVRQLGRDLEQAVAGRTRQIWTDLGIQVRGIHGQLLPVSQILNIIEEHMGGFADQFANTLPGALMKTRASFEDMLISLGQLLSPVILASARALQTIFEFIAQAARQMADSLGIVLPDLQNITGGAGGGGSGNQAIDYLQQITFNTGPQGALARSLSGGGSFSAAPGGAGGIRAFNQMMRTVK